MSEKAINKLKEFESIPPPGTWDKICNQLQTEEEAITNAFIKNSLAHYEADPPTAAWNNITHLLDGASKKNNIHSSAKIISIGKWVAAAAAVLGAILTIVWFNNSPTTVTATIQNAVPVSPAPVTPITMSPEKKEEDIVAIPSNMETNLSRKISSTRINTKAIHSIQKPIAIKVSEIKVSDDFLHIKMNNMLSSGYSTVMSPAGVETNVSIKFSRILNYINDETNSNPESVLWKNKMETWKNKLLQSGYTPGAGNFLDILELQNLLQEQ